MPFAAGGGDASDAVTVSGVALISPSPYCPTPATANGSNRYLDVATSVAAVDAATALTVCVKVLHY